MSDMEKKKTPAKLLKEVKELVRSLGDEYDTDDLLRLVDDLRELLDIPDPEDQYD